MAKGSILRKGLSANVSFTRKELRDRKASYQLIDACLGGERTIKAGGTKYLPAPNAADESEANIARYNAYLIRAVFYNVTQHTLSGFVGEVFRKDPTVELPTDLNVVLADANGEGLTLTQLAKKAMRYTLGKGRAGLLADYPAVVHEQTKADQNNERIKPTITLYDALSVINWRTVKDASQTILTLVVLIETYDTDNDDGFEVKQEQQYRVLRLIDGVYSVTIYRKGTPGDVVTPTDAVGKTFDRIPFTFIGSENNDSEIDNAPLYDLAILNIAHYRNSADYEESSFITGQPTPVFAGLTESWVDTVLKGTVELGSRGGVMLPEGGSATLLQAEPNTTPFEAMQHKEKQMVALGAKLVENKQVQRTATEAGIDSASEGSILSSTAKNVSAAIRFVLGICLRFEGKETTTELVYELNTDYSIARMTAQEQQQLIASWLQGALAFSEMRGALTRDGLATLSDDEAREETANDPFLVETDDGGEGE